MATTSSKMDPDERRMDIGAWILWLCFIVPLIIYAAYAIFINASDDQPSTKTVQVCPNVQPQLDQEDWRMYASWPPNTGIYKVTYSVLPDDTAEVIAIEFVDDDISSCS